MDVILEWKENIAIESELLSEKSSLTWMKIPFSLHHFLDCQVTYLSFRLLKELVVQYKH